MTSGNIMMRIINTMVKIIALLLISAASFAQEHKVLTLVSPHFPPYTYKANNKVVGLGPDLIRQVLDNTNIQYNIVMVEDYGEAVHVIKAKLADGMFLASHVKATEINKALMSFKDIFLIGFFLSIGFTALPTLEMLGLATLLILLIPIKFVMFYGIFSLLKMRCRSAFLSALSLSNFSEFGLIVGALSVSSGWLSNDWLVILALSMAISFILTNIVYRFAHTLFAKYRGFLSLFERQDKLEEDIFCQPSQRPIVIIGMGRVGMGAYQAINSHSTNPAWGLDADKDKITWLTEQGVEAYYGDAEDIHFWESMDLSKLELVLLALPSVQDAISITTQLNAANYQGKIAAVARYDDERLQLEEFGIDKVFNFYTEAGVGFAEESLDLLPKHS